MLLIAELPVIIFMTKIDECEPGLIGDLGQTFHSEKLYKLVQVRTTHLPSSAGVVRVARWVSARTQVSQP